MKNVRSLVAQMILSVALCLVAAPPLRGQELADRVDAAIERGVAHLWSLQRPDGRFLSGHESHFGHNYVGEQHVMSMVALAYAGEKLTRPEMQKGLKVLLELPLDFTYTLSFRVICLARLYRDADERTKSMFRQAVKRDVTMLLQIQSPNGGWLYQKPGGWDFSNTQIAVLALREAALCGVEVNRSIFERIQKLYLDNVRDDGGWNYYGTGNAGAVSRVSYGSMTAAAVASLFITQQLLDPGAGCPCRQGRSSGRQNAQLVSAINGGLRWLDKNFTAKTNPFGYKFIADFVLYWLYACERVGIATGMKYIGRHNWYAEGAEVVLARQDRSGSWGRVYQTSLALLFLLKGRAPILMNKLQFDGAWNQHPRDAANLAEYVGTAKEQQINWQIINLDAPVDEWHDAPILYITAESAPELTDAQRGKLRQFTDTGGTILFEASCGNRAVDHWWRSTCKRVWPEFELKMLAKDHGFWSADQKLMGRLPAMLGMADGVRTFIFYSPRDISCAWHTSAVARNRPLFDLGCNLYAYATDRGRLRDKLARSRVVEQPSHRAAKIVPGPRKALRVRLLKHGGDWYVSRHYRPLEALAEFLAARGGGLTLQVGDPVKADDPSLAETDVLWLTGRKAVTLSPEETAALKAWIAGGGYLVADACMGEAVFDPAFAALAGPLGLEVRTVARDGDMVTGGMGACSGFDLARTDFTHALRTERVGRPHAELRGLYQGGKRVGAYSPFDVALSLTGVQAFGNRGYAPGDARAVAANMILPATTTMGKSAE